MANVSIGLLHTNTEPSVNVRKIPDTESCSAGQQFIVIELGEEASVIPPGFGADAARYARTLAASLNAAADTIEAQHEQPSQPQPVSVEA